jgi:hypothetical protein
LGAGLRQASGHRSWYESALRASEKIEYFKRLKGAARRFISLSLERRIAYSSGLGLSRTIRAGAFEQLAGESRSLGGH